MDTKKEDTAVKTAPEAPAMPAPGEPRPGPSAVPSEPLHGPVDLVGDLLQGLQSAFRALSVEEVDTQPVKRKREREKDAGDEADEGVNQGHDPTNDPTFKGAPSASGLHASPSPITTTLPTPDPAAAASTPITNPPMAEGTGFTGIDAFPWGSWPRDAAVDMRKQAGRQSTALTGASSRSCHVTKRFRILATLKQGNKSMYSNKSGYVHMGLRLDSSKGITGQ